MRPHYDTPENFVAAYRRLLDEVYGSGMQFAKLAYDVPGLLKGGWALTALADVVSQLRFRVRRPNPGWRSYMPGKDPAPPERVPLSDSDFTSEAQRVGVLHPWRVTDAYGRVLPMWFSGQPVFLDNGKRVRPPPCHCRCRFGVG